MTAALYFNKHFNTDALQLLHSNHVTCYILTLLLKTKKKKKEKKTLRKPCYSIEKEAPPPVVATHRFFLTAETSLPLHRRTRPPLFPPSSDISRLANPLRVKVRPNARVQVMSKMMEYGVDTGGLKGHF